MDPGQSHRTQLTPAPQTTPMTFFELEKVLQKFKEDIYEAVEPVINAVEVPIQVEIYSVEIPILGITSMGLDTRKLLADKPHLNVSVAI